MGPISRATSQFPAQTSTGRLGCSGDSVRCGCERCDHWLESCGSCHHLGDGVPLDGGLCSLGVLAPLDVDLHTYWGTTSNPLMYQVYHRNKNTPLMGLDVDDRFS